tara:strand:+ start:98 stop:241 length:144 start_codon:yes stop_codon:yes gene_type:complete
MKKKLKSNKTNFISVSKLFVSNNYIKSIKTVIKNCLISSDGLEIKNF